MFHTRLSRQAAILFVATVCSIGQAASRAKPDVVVDVRTDRPEALYECGERASFRISVAEKGEPIPAGDVSISLTLDGGRVIEKKTLSLDDAAATIAGTLTDPGFLRCTVSYRKDGKRYVGYGGAGFEPERIKPTAVMPDDFDAFWEAGRAKLAAIPLDLQLMPLSKYSDDNQQSFKFSIANIDNTRCHGFLSVPKNRKPPFPAYVAVPGAGPGPSSPGARSWAAKGALGLVVSVHAYDCGQPVAKIKECYAKLNEKGIYSHHGAPDREKYYFRRAYLGIDRAISYLASRPDFDGKHLVVSGSSQGGGSALILAGLNPHVTAAAANVPALCDHAGRLAERSPGWPGLVRGKTEEAKAQRLKMSAYFDAVNFARKIKCPTIVSVGFIDRTCCPSSVYSAYNVIAAPKRLFTDPLAGHTWNVGQFRPFLGKWLPGQLGLTDPVPTTKE